MSEFTWGDLPKDQTDFQLITEYVTQAIQAHESDPEAHLGDGESLQTHRQNDVLDHPQQSVVIDKSPFSFFQEVLGGSVVSPWSAEVGIISGIFGRNMTTSLFSQLAVNGLTEMPFTGLSSYPENDLLYRFYLDMNGAQNSDGQLKLFWAVDNDPANPDRIEFTKSGTSYYFRIYVSNSLVHEYVLQNGGEFKSFITLYFNSVEQKIDLFLDGVLVSSYTSVDWHDLILPTLAVDASRITNTSLSVQVSRWSANYNLF